MPLSPLSEHILRTLLYYDIFGHPLSSDELFVLLPRNSVSPGQLLEELTAMVHRGILEHQDGFYALANRHADFGRLRRDREKLARRRLRTSYLMTHVIRRFPFVRGVFLSGDLSKGVASPDSDIDYVIVTAPGRLWICRSMLVLFKKIVLLNRRKYFCLNYYIDTSHLRLEETDYYTATEIAHLKPLHNSALFLKTMNSNAWIRRYFPNYRVFAFPHPKCNDRRSGLQRLLELCFAGKWADRLDDRLMRFMIRTWERRYPAYDAATRARIFRCSRTESRAFIGNFAEKVIELYNGRLSQYHLGTEARV